jgi:hypothetical protein
MPVEEEEDDVTIVDNYEAKQCSKFSSTNGRTSEMESTMGQKRLELSELPFLVTHWLSGYQLPENIPDPYVDDNDIIKRKEAMRRIHRAAAEIASAFSSLALFGTTVSHVSLYAL